MNNCLCIERNVFLNPSNKLTPSACNYTCGDQDDIVSGDCGGERAYNLFEYQEGHLYMSNLLINYYPDKTNPNPLVWRIKKN